MRRGRRPLSEPSQRSRAILRSLEEVGHLQKVGDRFGLSRERVRQIATRWGFDKRLLRGRKQDGLARRKATDAKYKELMSSPEIPIGLIAKRLSVPLGTLDGYLARRGLKRPRPPCWLCRKPLRQLHTLSPAHVCTSCSHTTRGFFVYGVLWLYQNDRACFDALLNELDGWPKKLFSLCIQQDARIA